MTPNLIKGNGGKGRPNFCKENPKFSGLGFKSSFTSEMVLLLLYGGRDKVVRQT